MPTYRLEEASSGRAGCQNKECKENKVKILKGELRLGTWVDTERFQSYFWRHWGCVTPKIISNLNELLEEGGSEEKDFNSLDGFEDLSSEFQEKVKNAVEQGHVDDADWKGDAEMNRPGKTGFRVRATKKGSHDQDKDDDSEEGEEEYDDAASKSTKKRSRTQSIMTDISKAAAGEGENGTPKAKKPRKDTPAPTPKKDTPAPTPRLSSAKKANSPAASDEETEEQGEKKKKEEVLPRLRSGVKRPRPSTASSTPKPTPAKRSKKSKGADGEKEPAEKAKRGRKKKST